MNKQYIWLILLFIIAVGTGIYFYTSTNNSSNTSYKNNEYNAIMTKTNTRESSDNTNNTNFVEIKNDTNSTSKIQNPPVETEISSFTTKIYSKNEERQNNISITCSTLNDTLVETNSTFSFNSVLGKSTSNKGYEKAEVFQDGEVVQALGGGKCQVSTTLYNAVLKVSELKVTERHPHSNTVPYIKKGKDAAVAYGSYDFKFINNTGSTIKIKAENTSDNITIKLLKLE